MTTSMKAAFTLTLNDQLTSGLQAIKKGFEDLRNKGSELTLGKLDRGTDLLRTLGREVRNLTSDLRSVEAVADRGWVKMKQMASVRFQSMKEWGGKTFGPQGVAGHIGVIGGAVAGVSLLKPVQDYADFQNIALHSAISKGLSGTAATAEANRLMEVFRKDALESGQSSTSISHAYQDLIQSRNDPVEAEGLLPSHSLAATAYNTTAESLGHSVSALHQNLGIDKTQMPGTLASMALASKSGRFKIEDFNSALPGITGNMAKLGMTGRGAADRVFAALEIVAQNSRSPDQAAVNFGDFMNAITAPHSARTFALHNRGMAPETREILDKYHVTGINLPKLLETARENHIDPVTAVLTELEKKTAGLPGDVRAEVLGAFIGNQESRDAANAMLQNAEAMKELVEHLRTADTDMLHRDAQTAIASPTTQLDIGKEAATQLERRVGEGFEPVVRRLVSGLETVLGGVDSVDKTLPGFANAALAVTAGLLSLVTVLGAIGVAAGPVSAGFALVGGAASAAVTVGLPAVMAALPVAVPLAVPLIAKLGSDAETPENRAALDQLAKERQSVQGGPQGDTSDGFGPDGRPLGLPSSTDIAPPKADPQRLDIHVHSDPGTSADVTAATPGLSFTIPNAGTTTNRP